MRQDLAVADRAVCAGGGQKRVGTEWPPQGLAVPRPPPPLPSPINDPRPEGAPRGHSWSPPQYQPHPLPPRASSLGHE